MILEVVEDPHSGLRAALAVVRDSGLSFGGTRFSAQSGPEEVVELARCMEAKLRPHRPEIGGAKAGFFCSPDHPGLPQLMSLAAAAWAPLLLDRVILGKDMGASDDLMEAFYAAVGSPQLAPLNSSSGPRWLRRFPGYRRHMTGQGVCWALKELHAGDLSGARVAIQGAGAVGLGSAVRLLREGAQIAAISDAKQCVWLREGLREEELLDLIQGGRIRPESAWVAGRASREALFSAEVDAFVLAASSNSVSAESARRMTDCSVVEGSNFGLTVEARKVLLEQGCFVVPDVVASSASAAMVAHQLHQKGKLGPEELWASIETCIRSEVREGLERWHRGDGDFRAWAFAKAGL